MNTRTFIAAAISILFPIAAFGQARPAADVQLTKITKNLITSPQFTYGGAEQFQSDSRAQWLEVEVEYATVAELIDELTFKYFILVNGKLLTGEVTHINIPAGRDHHSVMYVSPRALTRIMANRPLTAASIPNIAVQLVQQAVVKDELSIVRAQPQWFSAVPPVAGLVLNKNETPFAPLYWDRYEQIKPAAR